jgi:hypothetical protein
MMSDGIRSGVNNQYQLQSYERTQDALRDDSRTGLPILIRDRRPDSMRRQRHLNATGSASTRFSYQPTPGTVVFAGYSSLLTEPEGLRFGSLRRTNDGFFLKVSYLIRL